jgi:hypothetical protein
MGQNGFENAIRTLRITNKEPIGAKLIIDREGIASVRKIYPCLSHTVGDEVGDLGPL